MKITYAFGAGTLALLLAACGGGSDQAASDASAPTSADDGSASLALDRLGDETIVVRDQNGTMAGANLNLPDDFPNDVSLPGNLNIISTSTPLPNTHMVMGLSPDSPADVASAIQNSLGRDGWEETVSQEMTPQMTRVEFQKDDRMTNVTITENGDTSAVQILTGPKL